MPCLGARRWPSRLQRIVDHERLRRLSLDLLWTLIDGHFVINLWGDHRETPLALPDLICQGLKWARWGNLNLGLRVEIFMHWRIDQAKVILILVLRYLQLFFWVRIMLQIYRQCNLLWFLNLFLILIRSLIRLLLKLLECFVGSKTNHCGSLPAGLICCNWWVFL